MAAKQPEPIGFHFSIACLMLLTLALAAGAALWRMIGGQTAFGLYQAIVLVIPPIAFLAACLVPARAWWRRVRVALAVSLAMVAPALFMLWIEPGGLIPGLLWIALAWGGEWLFLGFVYMVWQSGVASAESPDDERHRLLTANWAHGHLEATRLPAGRPQPSGFRFGITHMMIITGYLAVFFAAWKTHPELVVIGMVAVCLVAPPVTFLKAVLAPLHTRKRWFCISIGMALLIILPISTVILRSGEPTFLVIFLLLATFVWLVVLLVISFLYVAWKTISRSSERPPENDP